MKKLLTLFVASILIILPSYAKTDKTSIEYLKNKKHFAVMNPVVENAAEKIIKKTLQKEIGKGKYKVKLEGYTLFSMKRGIFKKLEIEGKHLEIKTIPVPYLSLKSLTDYNWIDFKEEPAKIKTNITFAYNIELTEKSINEALNLKDYQKIIEKVNNLAYPLFALSDVEIRVRQDKVYVIMEYNLPLNEKKKNKKFVVSTNFKVDNGKIKVDKIYLDKAYGKIPLAKVANLINLLNPLDFTLDILNKRDCKGQIENVKIENNIIKIDGKLFVTGQG